MSNHPLEGHEFRDLDAERKRMAALLREKGPEHVRTLRSEAREQLSALEKQLVKTQEKVEKKVLHITEKYGPEAGEEEREDAAWRVARGHGSDLFAEAVERLKAQAEEATNPRWRAVYVGRYRHITRLIRDLYRRQEWHEDLKFRLWAVQHVLRAWAVGELEEETQRGGERSEYQGDHYAQWVGADIERATSLSHAYALALVSSMDGVDFDEVEQYRGQDYESNREVVRQAWLRSGYLDSGPYTSQKLERLKRRVKRYAAEGIPPERPKD